MSENIAFRLLLLSGKTLIVTEKYISGMAGEPMVIACLTIDGNEVNYKDIEGDLKPCTFAELADYIDSLGENNHAAAIAWVI